MKPHIQQRKACVNHFEHLATCPDCLATDAGFSFYLCPRCRRFNYDTQDIARAYCAHCEVTIHELREELVTELDLTHIAPENRPRRSNCWTAALLSLIQSKNPRAVLVHGWVRNAWRGRPGEKSWVHHAWVEAPGIGTYEDGSKTEVMVVVDLTQLFPGSRAVTRDVYYQATGVCNNPRPRHYSMTDATRAVLRNKTDGPWPEDLAEAPPDL